MYLYPPLQNLYLLCRDTFKNQNTCHCTTCLCVCVHLLDRYFRKNMPNTIFTRIPPRNIRIFPYNIQTHTLEKRWKFNIRLKRSCAEGSAIFIFHLYCFFDEWRWKLEILTFFNEMSHFFTEKSHKGETGVELDGWNAVLASIY